MSDTFDEDEKVPVPGEPGEGGPRRRLTRWGVIGVVAVAVVMAGYVVLATVQIPYFTQSPGAAIALDGRIQVEGAPSFESEGEMHFTTVSVGRQRATLLEAIGAWLDPAAELVDEELLLGDRTPEENRVLNQELMTDSQELAKRVALEYLGLDVMIPEGALVTQVQPESPADSVLEPGDVVVAAGGDEVLTADDLVDAIQGRSPGDGIDLQVQREGADGTSEVSVELAEREGEAFLGVAISDAIELTDLPFEIEVDTDRVGGPSAGLALTLSIIDILTEGDLSGGLRVATTGTIGADGEIGPIGGIDQKAHTVRRAGLEVFLVPAGDEEGVQEIVGDDIFVFGVANLEEALEALGSIGGETDHLALPESVRPAA